MANKDSNKARMNVVIRWRRKKNLCLRCGKDPHEGDCVEIYDKSDMRNVKAEPKVVNEDKKKETIVAYRKRKLLCLKCGEMVHSGDCIESYEQSDMRPEEEKDKDPRTVTTPKLNIFDRKEEKSNLDLEQTMRTKYNRDFILVDIRPNEFFKNRITFVDIRYLSKRFSNCIICIIGKPEKILPYAEVLQLKKLVNVVYLKNENRAQEIVNYIYDCKYFISFESEYTRFAKDKNIKCISLLDDDDIKNILSRIPKVKGE